MAKYKKVDNCGPVAYPDQSGRYLGDGEVVEDDDANDWAPLVALGFIEETAKSATEDKQESPAELASAVAVPTGSDPPSEEETVSATTSKSKGKRSKKNKKEEVEDGMSANDGDGAEGMDSSSPWKSDS